METWWMLLILKESTSCVSLDASLKAERYDQASGCVWWWQHYSYTCIHSRLILLLYLKYRELLLLTLFFSYWQIELSTKVVIHLVLCILLYCQAINSETFVTLLSKNNTLTISLLPLKFAGFIYSLQIQFFCRPMDQKNKKKKTTWFVTAEFHIHIGWPCPRESAAKGFCHPLPLLFLFKPNIGDIYHNTCAEEEHLWEKCN